MSTELMKREMKEMRYAVDSIFDDIEMIIGQINEENADCISMLTSISQERIVILSKCEADCTYEEFAALSESLQLLRRISLHIRTHPRRNRQ